MVIVLDPSMSVLILKNVPSEGPGTIEDFLLKNGFRYAVVDLQKEEIPETGEFRILVMMGGPMSVNEENLYPYIARERDLTREFISSGRKVLGVCLGAQIMAKALGSRVYAGPAKEVGWFDIELTDDGIRDSVLMSLAVRSGSGDFQKTFKVFHWHGETFDIPPGAVRLAQSGLYPNQAFRYGDNAYAFQFHIEVKREMIYEWLKDEESVDQEKLESETESIYDDYLCRAMNFYKAFFVSGTC